MKIGWTICICLVLLAVGVVGEAVPDPSGFFGSNDPEPPLIIDRGECESAEDLILDLAENAAAPIDLFGGDGVYARTFEGSVDVEGVMTALGFSSEEEVMSYLTESPLQPPRSSLDPSSLADLFRLIVKLCDEYYPLDGRVRTISFVKKGSELSLSAEVDLALEYLAKKCHLDFLPVRGVVSVSIRYTIENAQLSAHNGDICLCLEGCNVPDGVVSLFFHCSDKTGQTKALLADMVGNVIENACFSG